MKLIVHIGTHKTGTTAFQSICRYHKGLLSSDGVNFPSYGDWDQHGYSAWLIQARKWLALRVFLKSIYKESVELSCMYTLISGEDFENFLVDINLAKAFTNIALEIGFDELEWIVVRRDPFEYMQSIYAEKSKHKVVLTYEAMAESILKYGYTILSTKNYNYYFVFELNRFADSFRKHVSKNLNVVPFNDFIEGYAGRVILSNLLSSRSNEQLLEQSSKRLIDNKRLSLENVELNYLGNFLGISIDQTIYDSNKDMIDSLIKLRIQKNALLLDSVRQKFANRNLYNN